jgi:hypothetical protein
MRAVHLLTLISSPKNLALGASALIAATTFALDRPAARTTAAFTAAMTNDDSTLTTSNFSLTGTNAGSALFTITDALPGDWVQKNVTATSVGKGSLTLTVAAGSAPGVDVPLNGTDDRALMVRVERCTDNTFAAGVCTGVTGFGGGAGVASGASITVPNSVTFNAASSAGATTLQTDQPSGSYYYKVFLKIPSGTTSGGGDNDLINKSVKVTFTWQLTSSAASLRNTP